MNRCRFFAVLCMAVLFILSITQILIDAGMFGSSANDGALVDSSNSQKNYTIFIEIEDKTLYLLDDGECIKEYIISSGKSGSPSPLGCWTIIEKGDWGEGFGGSWLGLDVPWGTFQEEHPINYLRMGF